MSVLPDTARRDDLATDAPVDGAPDARPGADPADVRRSPGRRRTALAAALALVAITCVALMAWFSFVGR